MLAAREEMQPDRTRPIAAFQLLQQHADQQTIWNDDMWWKLGILVVLTAGLIFSVIPVRTHAVLYDPADPQPAPTLWTMVSNMYLTAGTVAVIVGILTAAVAVGFWIMRSA